MPNNERPIIRVNNLQKHFKSIKAVDGIDFHVNRGDIYGFLGPNGSGKSTTIRMLLSLISPDKGEIEVFGQSLLKNRKHILSRIGALIEKPDLYMYLSAYKNLQFLGYYSGYKASDRRIMEVLEMVGLAERAHSKVKTFSQGMKQRLGLAQALLHEPELLILDEPDTGLDPQGIKDIREIIKTLNRDKGMTLLVSSHKLHEIEMIANRMIIINKGKKIVEGDVHQLLSEGGIFVKLETNKLAETKDYLEQLEHIQEVKLESDLLQFYTHKEDVPDIIEYLISHDIKVMGVRAEQSLEDYFLTKI